MRFYQVGERYRRVMLKQRSLALILILLLMTMPWMAMLDTEKDELKENNIQSSGTLNGWPDVPTWRIGDKYTYETQFDVQQLIQQANVSASLNTLTGDTVYEVVDILFITIDGVQTLAYKMDVEGDFTSGSSGATLEGVSGTLDIEYSGEDLVRVRDLAVINSEFTLDVSFDPFNFAFLRQEVGVITFDTSYEPAKEKYDFPLHTGDQWYMGFMASTDVSGSSDFFDPSEFDNAGYENNSWQITSNGVPTEDNKNIKYSGCDDSYKINEWNATGVSQGFNWYCPAVRYNSWMRVSNAAGFTIDWLLKSYQPAQSSGVVAGSDPGTRDLEIEIGLQSIATLPDAEQAITIDYGGQQNNPQTNTNLQLRYEMAGTLLNPTTDSNGQATEMLNSSNVRDTTNSSDDYTSNGLIVWDPATEIIGAATIVIDLSLTPVDLIAQADAIIVTRIRDGNSQILTKSIGYNSLPGDLLSFSIPTQNRGLLSSPTTEVEIITPDGTSIREPVPSIPSYGEARVVVNWTVPAAASIGIQTMSITVDPDETVTEDGNRSNNYAEVEIFVGRVPTAQITVTDGVYTFENVTLDASASFDEDGGDVECRFVITKPTAGGSGITTTIENIDSEDCWTQFNWSDGGIWGIQLIVTDDELDVDIIDITAEVFNRDPYINLTLLDSFGNSINSIGVGQFVKADASDSGDLDFNDPEGFTVVEISWPGLNCQEGTTQETCTFLVNEEGMMNITAVAEDDDGATTTVSTTLEVLNVAPTLALPELWYGGQNQSTDSMGYWNLYEDETALLRIVADDTPLDKDTLIIEWMPSDRDMNWTESTVGPSSTATVSWPDSGLHNISVVAYDNDNSQSQIRTGIVNITNVPPTIESLGSTQPIFEDDDITFTAVVSDTASDVDSLIVCWDLSPMVDGDSDGVSDNDCDETGLELTASWPNMGIRQITATVTDDDGASASTSVNVSVLNISPKSKITNETDVLALNEGDNVTLSGITSTETPSDKLNLIYAWDSDHLDSDLDGENTGEVDFYGVEYTIEDLPAGNWIVTLTVTDDDGESTSSTIELSVAEKPADNFLESITDTVGGVGSVVIIILLIVVVGLAAFLLLTRNSEPVNDKYSDLNLGIEAQVSQFSEPIPAQTYQQTEYGAYDQTASQSVAQDPYAAYNPAPTQAVAQDPYAAYNPAPTQPVAPQPVEVQPATPQAPPLPATGLPQGWTMEQWQHYGAQYLAAQNTAPAPVQPTITDTRPATANSNLTDLLDDLDL
ncbi:MAG: hypothetical protein CMA45_03660 [Euryarchaeota archaeon]|nr:hypothetical protein [Euryarchaeota archaeon]